MTIDSGSLSFARFRVRGGPKTLDADLLETLRAGVIRPPAVGAPPEIQAGWAGARHVLDAEIDAETVLFGDQLVFGLRVDTNRVPAELRRAYRALAFREERGRESFPPQRGGNDSRPLSSREEADEQCREALASGRFVRSRLVPIVWDVGRRLLLAPVFAETLAGVLRDQFRATFDGSLEPETSGALASAWFGRAGRGRDFEDLKPASYTSAPPAAEPEAGRPLDVPAVPWSFPDRAARDFLGNEFLIWLWHGVESGSGLFETKRGAVGVTFDRALDMDCAWDVTGRQTLRARGPLRLPEARAALAHGKWPRKAGLIVAAGAEQWDLTLQGDRFLLTGVRWPRPETAPESRRERVEERLARMMALDETMVALYHAFLEERAGAGWPRGRDRIRGWIRDLAGPRPRAGSRPAAVSSSAAPSDVPRPTAPS